MNINFNPEEHRTVFYILSEIIVADEIVHPKEKEFFEKVFNEFGGELADMDVLKILQSFAKDKRVNPEKLLSNTKNSHSTTSLCADSSTAYMPYLV